MNNNKLKTSCSRLILEASTGYSFVSHRAKNSIHTKNHITQQAEIDMDAIFTAPKNSQKQRQPFVIRPIMTSEKKKKSLSPLNQKDLNFLILNQN